MVEPPEGVVRIFSPQTVNDVVGMARANSLWPYLCNFLLRYCSWRTMASLWFSSIWIWACEFSPRQADMLMVMGTISKKPYLTSVYEQMSEPRWLIAVGACASSGGIFDTTRTSRNWRYTVDVYSWLPPRPEQNCDGVMKLQELLEQNQ
jgi:NADH-quinone oxidoreductase subunit B